MTKSEQIKEIVEKGKRVLRHECSEIPCSEIKCSECPIRKARDIFEVFELTCPECGQELI